MTHERAGQLAQPSDLVDVAHVFGKWADSLDSLADAPDEVPVPAWLRADPHGWAAVLREQARTPMPPVPCRTVLEPTRTAA